MEIGKQGRCGLYERIAHRDGREVLWISAPEPVGANSDDAEVVRVADLTARRAAVETSCTGRVVLDLDRPLDLAAALTLVDGVADAMLLLPTGLAPKEKATLIASFDADLVLSSRREDGLQAPEIPALLWADVIAGSTASPVATEHGDAGATETEWVLATSGTTATPKLVSHSLRSLTRTTREPRPDNALRDLRWGLLYSPERFAGLQVLLQAIWAESVLLFPPAGRPPEEVFRFLVDHGCSSLSCTPSWARRMLQSPAGRSLLLRQITLGGEIADAGVLAALAAAFPEARRVHIYASTEAGVGFSVRDGRTGFPAAYLDDSVDGVDLEIRAGRLWLRPNLRDQQWLEAPAQDDSESQPTSVRVPVADPNGWIDSGDLVERSGDRVLFLGRAAGAINVGGSKVLPEEVERTILEVDGVQDCLVQGRRSGWLGELVEAFVVRDGDQDRNEIAERVRRSCAARLPKFKVPALVHVVDDLELAAAGKKSRRPSDVSAAANRKGARAGTRAKGHAQRTSESGAVSEFAAGGATAPPIEVKAK